MKSKKERLLKNYDEIIKIKKAVKFTEQSIEHALSEFQKGMTEKELSSKIKNWVDDRGLKLSCCLVQGDANSASIHGKPTDHKIRNVLLLDIGVIYKGYHGDISRTYLLNPTRQMKKVYNIVKKSYDESVSAIKHRVDCKEIDSIARKIIKSNGYKFLHSLGHGIGREIHEYPKISPKSKHVFAKNMTFTIEPGIYLKNKFGIRIEDDFLLKNKLHKLSKIEIPEYD